MNSQTQIGNDIDGLGIGHNFGHSVSLSSDGTIVAASGFGGTSEDGRLRVFKNINGVWTLYGTDINGNSFDGMGAYSISLSDDGNTLAAGRWDDVVKVFTYDSATNIWTQKGIDITNTTGNSAFGDSIDLSSDGNTIAIGVSGLEHPFLPVEGITQVFHFDAGVWNQVGNDINGLLFHENSGLSVSMSSDGNIIAVSNLNSVRVYQNISGNWTIMDNEILAPGNSSGACEISLSSNGEILAIGEPNYTDSLIQRGRVRVFNFTAGTWNQIGSDILGEVAHYRTGRSVNLSSNGQILAIGETGSTSGSTDTGRTRIFQNQNNSWVQLGNGIFGESNEDYSGRSVRLSSDASKIVIGAPLNDGSGIDSGHLRVFDLTHFLSINDFDKSKINVYPNPTRQQFNIQLNVGMKLEKVNIYNSLGELVFSVINNIINTSKLSAGMYFVEITTNKGKATKKIVIL